MKQRLFITFFFTSLCGFVFFAGSMNMAKAGPFAEANAAAIAEAEAVEQILIQAPPVKTEQVSPRLAGLAHGRKNQVRMPAADEDPEKLWGFSELDPKGENLESLLREGFPLVVVNKSKNRVYLARYNNHQIQLVKSYHALYGKLPGDKTLEGDLRTPEGIYYFNSFARYPKIPKKLGEAAVGLNYPNPVDRMAGKTGYDILLHATFEDERLNRNFDSEGCVVVENRDIDEISSFVTLGVTPILIFSQLEKEHLAPGEDKGLMKFFHNWLASWNGKDISGYMASYSKDFKAPNGKDWNSWRNYKNALNKKYKWIKVKASNPRFFIHPKYAMVAFKQDYRSDKYVSIGTKILYTKREEGEYKIVSEDFSRVIESPVIVRNAKNTVNSKKKPDSAL